MKHKIIHEEEIKTLDWKYFFKTLAFVLLFFVLLFPNIYLHQQIYLKSRNIAKLQVEYETLKEEQKIIKASVESLKFKNQILDTIF